MSTKLTLTGDPKSTNNIYKSVCVGKYPKVYITNEGKAIKEGYQWEAKSQYRKKPMKDELEVWTTLYLKTKRRADIDNFHKLLLDSLTGIVWEDDSQIVEYHISKRHDAKNPRIEIEVLEIGDK